MLMLKIISKDEKVDSGTESVNESKDSVILNRTFVISDISEVKHMIDNSGAE